jgi:hypothetical protein
MRTLPGVIGRTCLGKFLRSRSGPSATAAETAGALVRKARTTSPDGPANNQKSVKIGEKSQTGGEEGRARLRLRIALPAQGATLNPFTTAFDIRSECNRGPGRGQLTRFCQNFAQHSERFHFLLRPAVRRKLTIDFSAGLPEGVACGGKI